MKAAICKKNGKVEDIVITDMPPPQMREDHLRIRVRSCALNFPDILTIEGKYQRQPPLPFAPGMECAGEVMEVGPKAKGNFKVGDRVMAQPGVGCLAEQVCCSPLSAYAIPDNVSYEHAAGFIVTYGTVYHAFVDRGDLKSGESLLVLGAAGGVGLAAVELGRLMGAKVIAAASTDAKLKICAQYGADHLLNYTQEPIKDTVLGLTGEKGVDVVFDPVGGDATAQSLRCINRNGRLLIIGFASGVIPDIPANRLLLRQCQAVGVAYGSYGIAFPEKARANMAVLTGWWAEGKLKPHVSMTFPLAESVSALNALAGRKAIGKVVVNIG
ncbi:MAG TPA: NADPH:quinone oxidoreductase family protein [Alphaproteobacteria bacterium]|nr:NADPH:quinone oxidoreductase family protein [Alphaproteobacteria bacterium]